MTRTRKRPAPMPVIRAWHWSPTETHAAMRVFDVLGRVRAGQVDTATPYALPGTPSGIIRTTLMALGGQLAGHDGPHVSWGISNPEIGREVQRVYNVHREMQHQAVMALKRAGHDTSWSVYDDPGINPTGLPRPTVTWHTDDATDITVDDTEGLLAGLHPRLVAVTDALRTGDIGAVLTVALLDLLTPDVHARSVRMLEEAGWQHWTLVPDYLADAMHASLWDGLLRADGLAPAHDSPRCDPATSLPF